MQRDELVFGVSGSVAVPASPITLAEAGLRERSHLQEWVLAHPEMLGSDVLVITSEFDRWASRDGKELDRLDILGLDASGRLVVAELKRDVAPDFVALQAIKYAAMASRFTIEDLVRTYLDFHGKDEDGPANDDEALSVLTSHAPGLSVETLQSPRIVLLAGSFPAALTSAVVWLDEQGVDFTLVQIQAYHLEQQHLVTVSQVWPVTDIKDFVVAPARAERAAKPTSDIPAVAWTQEDLSLLASTVGETILAAMDLCSATPNEWIGGDKVMAWTGRGKNVHRGDFGGFGITVRRRFNRSNAPYEMSYGQGEVDQQYYRVTPDIADMWRSLRRDAVAEAAAMAQRAAPMDGDIES